MANKEMARGMNIVSSTPDLHTNDTSTHITGQKMTLNKTASVSKIGQKTFLNNNKFIPTMKKIREIKHQKDDGIIHYTYLQEPDPSTMISVKRQIRDLKKSFREGDDTH